VTIIKVRSLKGFPTFREKNYSLMHVVRIADGSPCAVKVARTVKARYKPASRGVV